MSCDGCGVYFKKYRKIMEKKYVTLVQAAFYLLKIIKIYYEEIMGNSEAAGYITRHIVIHIKKATI